MSKNWGVAGTDFNFGKADASLNCFEIFTFDKSGSSPSVIFKEFPSRKFSRDFGWLISAFCDKFLRDFSSLKIRS